MSQPILEVGPKFFSTLSDHIVLEILLLLHEKRKMSFNEIKKKLELQSTQLARSLQNYWKSTGKPYYELTFPSDKLIPKLLDLEDLMERPQPKIRMVATDLSSNIDKVFFLKEEDICFEGYRKEGERTVLGVPHRDKKDCQKFCKLPGCH